MAQKLDSKDLKKLDELTKKAAYAMQYDIAHMIKVARDALRTKLTNEWTESTLNQIKEHENEH